MYSDILKNVIADCISLSYFLFIYLFCKRSIACIVFIGFDFRLHYGLKIEVLKSVDSNESKL